MTKKKCPTCGTEFEGRANKIYCSNRCKMAAFYNPTDSGKNELTVTQKAEKPFQSSLTDSKNENGSQPPSNMETVPVDYTHEERALLEKQAKECQTVLPKLIRIRSLMEETDTRIMQQTIQEQKLQLEELRVKLSFYQKQNKQEQTGKTLNNESGLLIRMNPKQLEFLKEKYLESWDFENEYEKEILPNGGYSSNKCTVLEENEKKYPGAVEYDIESSLLCHLLVDIQQRLIDHCFYNDDDFLEESLYEQFQELE